MTVRRSSSFPGSNCDHDAYHAAKHVLGQDAEFVWHKDTDLKGADVVILPGGFAHGDYLRTGAMARFSPIMGAVQRVRRRAAARCSASATASRSCSRRACCPARCCATASSSSGASTCTSASSRPTRRSPARAAQGQVLRMPIAHGEGNYFARAGRARAARGEPPGGLPLHERRGRGDRRGESERLGRQRSPASATRRATSSGLMPHPERACESALGSADGLRRSSSRSCRVRSRPERWWRAA